jgi:hypothetical protein
MFFVDFQLTMWVQTLVLQLPLFEFQLGASFLIVRAFGVGLVMTSPE